MKVLHLASGNLKSGAFLGTLNLHNELNKNNIKSILLNDIKIRDVDIKNYHTLSNNIFIKLKIKIINIFNNLPKFIYLKKNKETFNNSFFGINLSNEKILDAADIIHVHWIAKSYSDLSLIAHLNKPIVWTFRDMWPFTGGCHYSLGCNRFKKSCGKCRVLGSTNPNDISNINHNIKKKKLSKNVHFVAISNWLKNQALSSPIIKKKNIEVIYSGVNYKNFFPSKNKKILKKYNIKKNKKIIIFGAQNINAKYKGLEYFIESTKFLNKRKFIVIFFGSFHDKSLLTKINIPYICLDKINSIEKMRSLLSLADVYVFSSIQEAFGKSAVESLLCGTPVVCFKNTAISEIIDHKKNGYLSKYLSAKNLSKGVKWITSKPKDHFKKNCLSVSKQKFDIKYCTKQYIKIYKKIFKKIKKF